MKKLMLATVLIHFAIAGWHGGSHQGVPVPLSLLQTAYVAIVIIALPLLGAALSFSRHALLGAALVCGSMAGSLVFGLLNHFILESPDNIGQIAEGPWRSSFVISAVVIAISEALGMLAGAAEFRRLRQAQRGETPA